MDNEASAALKLLLQKRRSVVQLSPPHINRKTQFNVLYAHLKAVLWNDCRQ